MSDAWTAVWWATHMKTSAESDFPTGPTGAPRRTREGGQGGGQDKLLSIFRPTFPHCGKLETLALNAQDKRRRTLSSLHGLEWPEPPAS